MAQTLRWVTCWRHFGWNHWSAKSVKNFSWFLVPRDLISSSCMKVSCFLFLSNIIPQYCSTASMVLSAIICGHSVCKHLQVDMQAGTDTKMQPSFKLKETAQVRMFGKGGKMICNFVHCDIPIRQRYRPDTLILLLGDDTGTSAEEITNHLITLASQLHIGGQCYVRRSGGHRSGGQCYVR